MDQAACESSDLISGAVISVVRHIFNQHLVAVVVGPILKDLDQGQTSSRHPFSSVLVLLLFLILPFSAMSLFRNVLI